MRPLIAPCSTKQSADNLRAFGADFVKVSARFEDDYASDASSDDAGDPLRLSSHASISKPLSLDSGSAGPKLPVDCKKVLETSDAGFGGKDAILRSVPLRSGPLPGPRPLVSGTFAGTAPAHKPPALRTRAAVTDIEPKLQKAEAQHADQTPRAVVKDVEPKPHRVEAHYGARVGDEMQQLAAKPQASLAMVSDAVMAPTAEAEKFKPQPTKEAVEIAEKKSVLQQSAKAATQTLPLEQGCLEPKPQQARVLDDVPRQLRVAANDEPKMHQATEVVVKRPAMNLALLQSFVDGTPPHATAKQLQGTGSAGGIKQGAIAGQPRTSVGSATAAPRMDRSSGSSGGSGGLCGSGMLPRPSLPTTLPQSGSTMAEARSSAPGTGSSHSIDRMLTSTLTAPPPALRTTSSQSGSVLVAPGAPASSSAAQVAGTQSSSGSVAPATKVLSDVPGILGGQPSSPAA